MIIKHLQLVFILLLTFTISIKPTKLNAQSDSISFFKRNAPLFTSATFMTAGLLMIDNQVYDRYDYRNDIKKQFPNFETTADDYIQYIPVPAVYILDWCGVKAKNSFYERSILLFKSELLAFVVVNALKYSTLEERPNGKNLHSFPSGHTTQAFVAATFMHKELGYQSIWYSVGAYSVATATGVLRTMNDVHWISDVLFGAGLGILCTEVSYRTHRYKWTSNGYKIGFLPFAENSDYGGTFYMQF